MTAVVLCTIGAALGVVGITYGCHSSRRTASNERADAAPYDPAGLCASSPGRRWVPERWVPERWVTSAAQRLVGRPALVEWLQPSLVLTDTSWAQLVRRGGTAAAGGLAAAFALLALQSAATGQLSILTGLVVVLLAPFGALATVVVRLRHAGDRRRQQASQAVGTYLDLVVLCLAGGMGIEGALDAAASIAEDPFSARIAAVLDGARHAGRPPWQALEAMGGEVGVSELVELAHTVSLAGTEGARVRATLAAKAETLRRRQLAKTESEANAMTERLFLPGALLLIGFLVFIGYPALARILSGL